MFRFFKFSNRIGYRSLYVASDGRAYARPYMGRGTVYTIVHRCKMDKTSPPMTYFPDCPVWEEVRNAWRAK